jgi:hypothetical protein
MSIRNSTVVGALLILTGVFLFLNRGEAFLPGSLIGYVWPSMFLIPLGLLFHWMYFSVTGRKGVGLLIPGGIILTTGIVCQIATLFDSWGTLWPGFIMAVAVGLFEFYWFGSRNKYLLIPIYILSGLSAIFFTVFSVGTIFSHMLGSPFIAIVLVLAGLILLFTGKKKHM